MPTPKRRGDLGQGETINATGKKINTGAFGADKKAGRSADALSATAAPSPMQSILRARNILRELPEFKKQMARSRWFFAIQEAEPSIRSVMFTPALPGGFALQVDGHGGLLHPASPEWKAFAAEQREKDTGLLSALVGGRLREEAEIDGTFTLDANSATVAPQNKILAQAMEYAQARGTHPGRWTQALSEHARACAWSAAASSILGQLREIDPNIVSFEMSVANGSPAVLRFASKKADGSVVNVTPLTKSWDEYVDNYTPEQLTVLLGGSAEAQEISAFMGDGTLMHFHGSSMGIVDDPDDYSAFTG